MSLSRRTFVKVAGVAGASAIALPFISARGREALVGDVLQQGGSNEPVANVKSSARLLAPNALRLDSNENPHGPSARALAAVQDMFKEASRYPDVPVDRLKKAIAEHHHVKPSNVLLGCGSGEVLRIAAYTFTGPNRPLVTGAPTFEDPAHFSQVIGAPVRAVKVDDNLRLDLPGMAAQANGAGLIFLCNPNNPTATVHSAQSVRDFTGRVGKSSPDTTIVVDEAYFELVDDPAYGTMVPVAMENPHVVVSRTFSKIHGMAGLRVGYAIADEKTIAKMERHKLSNNVNQLGAAAALATLGDVEHIESERQLNREAKEYTRRFFESAGYKVVPSETNFMMVDIRRDSKQFQEAVRARDILIGRPFPPLTTYARISIGTMDEMRHATEVFKQLLASA